MSGSTQSMRDRIVASALWSAYGDALGFPTELASPSLIQQRLGSSGVSGSIPWRRMIGGRFGVQVNLPAGAYSDDTQLRLASSRAIRADGFFDVEAFAKIELPVWLSYALGAGRGSKAAASSLASKSNTWYSNFFSTEQTKYTNGGGNGAAMRIQPHVWSARDLGDFWTYLPDVVRNAVCTHGHLRGIAGAMVHAAILAHVLRTASIPPPEKWMEFAEVIELLPEVVRQDSELATFWLPTWEGIVEHRLDDATASIADEWARDAARAIDLLVEDPISSYSAVVENLGGFSEKERGSGLKSALFALVGAYALNSLGTGEALVVMANLLESDTDTIASMGGALLGALQSHLPHDTIQDRDYIVSEALRMSEIATGLARSSFEYPDLLYWLPPKNAIDSVGVFNGELALAGLGRATVLNIHDIAERNDAVWQWAQLEFGQTILYKRRTEPSELRPESLPGGYKVTAAVATSVTKLRESKKETVAAAKANQLNLLEKSREDSVGFKSLDSLTDDVIQANFNPRLIGEHILYLTDSDRDIEIVCAYTAILAKARKARKKRSSN